MSRVYSWQQLSERRFASVKDLSHVRSEALKVLRAMHERGWLCSGQLIGSVARGDFTPGSDFDVLLVSNPGKEKAVRLYLSRAYRALRGKHSVKIGVTHVTLEEASGG